LDKDGDKKKISNSLNIEMKMKIFA